MTTDSGDELRDHRLREVEGRLQTIEQLMNAVVNSHIKTLEVRITHLEDVFASVSDKIDDLRTNSKENSRSAKEILSVLHDHVVQENKDRVVLLYAVVGALVSGLVAIFLQFVMPHIQNL